MLGSCSMPACRSLELLLVTALELLWNKVGNWLVMVGRNWSVLGTGWWNWAGTGPELGLGLDIDLAPHSWVPPSLCVCCAGHVLGG